MSSSNDFLGPDFGAILGLGIVMQQWHQDAMASARYNSIMQGYMSQGYTAEQATMLTDEHFRPQRLQAAIQALDKRIGWSVLWLLLGGCGFVGALVVLFVAPASGLVDMALTAGLVYWMRRRLARFGQVKKALQADLAAHPVTQGMPRIP